MKVFARNLVRTGVCLSAVLPLSSGHADEGVGPAMLPIVQVTATRLAESVDMLPVSVSVIPGSQLTQRGASDLRSALALATGVEVAPGGDGGPASAVPAIWGLRELDDYLLVVDGVPWGGAFLPAVSTLDLTNVERIEVLRGSAPVMYGATSFSGVIHVIHRAAGEAERRVYTGAGSYGRYSGAASEVLPSILGAAQSLTVNGERTPTSDPNAGYDRLHALYRVARGDDSSGMHLDLDVARLRQAPDSPQFLDDATLRGLTPLDANFNPAGARLNEDRVHLAAGYHLIRGDAEWDTTLSLSRTGADIVRGFLQRLQDDGSTPNAEGYRQHRNLLDIYVDSHWAQPLARGWQVLAGADGIFGKARLGNDLFDYYVPLAGGPAQSDAAVSGNATGLQVRRLFSGAYTQLEWSPSPAFKLLTGVRLNVTDESRSGYDAAHPADALDDHRRDTRWSGTVGLSWRAWQSGADQWILYSDYRSSFKPADVDFGPESEESRILRPQTGTTYEAGLRGSTFDGRLRSELSVFDMELNDLVVTSDTGLTNSGHQRIRGGELELRLSLPFNAQLFAEYAHHQARFRNTVQDFGGTPQSLDGRWLPLTPEQVAGAGLLFSAPDGWHGSLGWNYAGRRYLDKRNQIPAPGYATLHATLGYRYRGWSLLLRGDNLSNRRDPVAESELAEDQYFRLPGRRVGLQIGRDLD